MVKQTMLLAIGLWAGAVVADDVYVSTEIVDGMTGVQQLTNAFTRLSKGELANGSTIHVAPGEYDFGDVTMALENYSKDGVDYVITNHLYLATKSFTLVGDVSVTDGKGHWDDQVVFKGKGRCLSARVPGSAQNTNKIWINNITFDGFDGGDYPCGGSFESRGGALKMTDCSSGPYHTISNCVFRNNHAYIGGAVNGSLVVDCLFHNNNSTYNGGCGCNTSSRGCVFYGNRADGHYSVHYSGSSEFLVERIPSVA